MGTVIDIIQCWQGCEEMKTIMRDNDTLVQAPGILECPHAPSAIELLPWVVAHRKASMIARSHPTGSLGTRTSVSSTALELWRLSPQLYSVTSKEAYLQPAPELDLNPAKYNEYLGTGISQNSRTGIYNLLVPGKHWITADTPKLAKASALPKVHWCFCETVILEEIQGHQEKSSIRFYKVINKGLKKKKSNGNNCHWI